MSITGLLLDLEGVLYQGDEPLPGAINATRALAAAGVAIRYLTNTTTRPRRAIVQRLGAMGLEVRPEHVFTPGAAACRLLSQHRIRRLHLAAPAGLDEDFGAFQLVDREPEAVVLGDLHTEFTWQRLNGLFRMIQGGARLIALHRNRYCRRDGDIGLDLGPFVAALEYAAGVQAEVVGKPERAFFALALADLGRASDEVAMVGDDLEADIGGAQRAGLRAIQVETGKFTPRDRRHPTIRPDLCIASIAELPAALERLAETP